MAVINGLGINPYPPIPNGSVTGVNLTILGKSVSGISLAFSTATLEIGIADGGFT